MKVNVEIDCTPEEARRFMGLPDVSRANDVYVDSLVTAMKGAGSLDQVQDLIKGFAPMGEMGLRMFQQIMESGTKAAFGTPTKKS
ncbi:DUF6489 family protein [Croceicoccus gelatinilyticus]|uniref:DUF6489 family protein n=1 Tax=Croceicoccus gelatinilyticus TaxID=2835536 RepID=UPI001BCE2983|nr:DUF6489 family protein [Croceicoccus gelatinilyticus]MBS7669831.1 hypothetical protein [Croceicoccus gelatinilyticus]